MFVPLIDLADASQASLANSASYFNFVIVKGSLDQVKALVSQTESTLYWAHASSVEEATQLWDAGIHKVIFSADVYTQVMADLEGVSVERVAVSGSTDASLAASAFILTDATQAAELASSATLLPGGGEKSVVVELTDVSLDTIASFGKQNVHVVVPGSRLTTEKTGDKLSLADAFLATAKTDREDGLYTTIVVDEQNKALGLVYSSKESVAESIRVGEGVYQSRARGLWHKGLTSGATQTLKRIDYDCDGDALRFVVQQHGAGKKKKVNFLFPAFDD
jgi:phosphoribosyl-ATP pyrophosphohydrolase/phosphoribosyl-AMP cyclohydrolase/histidinol dehydrogenase